MQTAAHSQVHFCGCRLCVCADMFGDGYFTGLASVVTYCMCGPSVNMPVLETARHASCAH